MLNRIKRNKIKTIGVASLLIATSLGLGLDFLGYSLSQVVLSLLGAGQWAFSAPVWQTALISTAMASGLGGIAFLAYVAVRKIRNRGLEKPKTMSVKSVDDLISKIKELEQQEKQVVSIQFKQVSNKKTVILNQVCIFNTDDLISEGNGLIHIDEDALMTEKNKDDYNDIKDITITYKKPDYKLSLKALTIDADSNENEKKLILDPKFLSNIAKHEERGFIVSQITFKSVAASWETTKENLVQRIYIPNMPNAIKVNVSKQGQPTDITKDGLYDEMTKSLLDKGLIDENTNFIVHLTPPKGKKVAMGTSKQGEHHIYHEFVPIEYPIGVLAAKDLKKNDVPEKTMMYTYREGKNDYTQQTIEKFLEDENVCETGTSYKPVDCILFDCKPPNPAYT